jgi:hypothetical protein
MATEEEWLDFMRAVVLTEDEYDAPGWHHVLTSDPELDATVRAVESAQLVMRVAKEKLPGNEKAEHWVRSAVEEVVAAAYDLAEKWGV